MLQTVLEIVQILLAIVGIALSIAVIMLLWKGDRK